MRNGATSWLSVRALAGTTIPNAGSTRLVWMCAARSFSGLLNRIGAASCAFGLAICLLECASCQRNCAPHAASLRCGNNLDSTVCQDGIY
jgi:hypothetical protein